MFLSYLLSSSCIIICQHCNRFPRKWSNHFCIEHFLHKLTIIFSAFSKEDQVRLSMIMTEWEYLYCKLLLINNIVEGDSGLILKRRSPKKCKESSQLKHMHSNSRNSFSNAYYQKKELTKCFFIDNQNETVISTILVLI